MDKTDKIWHQSGNKYYLNDIASQKENLSKGVYTLKYNDMKGFYLDLSENEFTFSHKIYGKDSVFINRCIKTYTNTVSNLGVLLSGLKGTGKSVTAKQLCNKLNLPVVVINEAFDDIATFLSEISQDVIVLIDEYEKIFEKSYALLPIMDGVSMSKYRRVFILSTNDTFINENLLNRPSRIRYHKAYGNLDADTCREIIDDILINKEFKEDLLEVISTLSIVTIDLVISLIEEVNIHQEKASIFITTFNAEKPIKRYDVLDAETGSVVYSNVEFEHYDVVKYSRSYVGCNIYVDEVDGATTLLGEYAGCEEGVFTFKNDKKKVKYKFRKAINTYYAY